MFANETQLVESLKSHLSSSNVPFHIREYALEFNYIEGRTDLIAKSKNGELIAFETKLVKWRKAIHQAYRNSSFAHYSYVVFPINTIKNVLGRETEFRRRGIGLCSLDKFGINIEIEATKQSPLLPWLTDTALKYISKPSNG